MIKLDTRHDDPTRWRLINRTSSGADVLAHQATAVHRPPWPEALAQLREGRGELEVVRDAGMHFRWLLHAADGSVVAESPAVHRDAEACRISFDNARRAARTALGPARTGC
ncbi:hypothetical protein COUCH_26880 [Couchioplanes caeruleus]|uniref:hypothetical protein n=1 Tax=Couchioplanes caeruleus TaxID=56438 RepID=UPI0020BFA584|nr:hypothetical protein [Couchioplanes caeruleus]UQU62641.1 hypothetical protein COUCH_26880 [Couchioplanes caeruleus]